MIDNLNSKYKELIKSLLQIQTNLEKADKEKSLYLTHKLVKELCILNHLEEK